LTKRNYKNWSDLVLDNLRSDHKEVFPFLCSNKLISNTELQPPLYILWDIIILNLDFDTKHVINMITYPHDMWMALWKKYGDPIVHPFSDDILSFVALVMVPPTPEEIPPPDTPIAPIDPVPPKDASDSVQQQIPCLPTSASWDEFLPDIARLFMESHIEYVGDIIDDIRLLFEVDTSSFATVVDSCTLAL
jgi:hypothetical protein